MHAHMWRPPRGWCGTAVLQPARAAAATEARPHINSCVLPLVSPLGILPIVSACVHVTCAYAVCAVCAESVRGHMDKGSLVPFSCLHCMRCANTPCLSCMHCAHVYAPLGVFLPCHLSLLPLQHPLTETTETVLYGTISQRPRRSIATGHGEL